MFPADFLRYTRGSPFYRPDTIPHSTSRRQHFLFSLLRAFADSSSVIP